LFLHIFNDSVTFFSENFLLFFRVVCPKRVLHVRL